MAGPTYMKNLTGANCQVGGQTIISLNAAEDLNTDFRTASAVCLAPSGRHEVGEVVQTVEGGVSTGYWEVESWDRIRSGEQTWRKAGGGSKFSHLPLYSYKLRGKGYSKARGTLSKVNIGSDRWPPKFGNWTYLGSLNTKHHEAILKGEMTSFDARDIMKAYQGVWFGWEVISHVCSWLGLPVQFRAWPKIMPEEYLPVDKPLLAVCKEVAAWSGCSCYLDRNGTLQVYDFQESYGRRGGANVPVPASVLEESWVDSYAPVTEVIVVGYKVRRGYFGEADQQIGVEEVERIAIPSGTKHVTERIEIKEYPISEGLGKYIARERLSRVVLEGTPVVYRGPAEGSQSYAPLTHNVFSVKRNLSWDGKGMYRYEAEITGPRSVVSWGPITGSWDRFI